MSLIVAKSYGSVGDSSAVFRQCTYNCKRDLGCLKDMAAFQWNLEPCFSCRQKCIWTTVDDYKQKENDVPQFFGKWPFLPISLPLLSFIPIQEPASVIFSLLNLYTTVVFYKGICRLRRLTHMKGIWKAYGFIGIFAWFSSTCFHWSDFWLTEYFDYFSAFCLILFAFYASISFVLSPFYSLWVVRLSQKGLFIALFFTYVSHIRSMVRSSLIYLGAAMIVLVGSGLMEIIDYPPLLWIFDSHSLFHLGTIPFPLLMLRFVQLENQFFHSEDDGYLKIA
uniref:Post-GPI attachment to proteins factor 3 n=1 Tax=Syphacia muris TaxID=451379 RepID=A0A0N5AQK8_9BILA